jgi:IS30 family transposase
LCKPVLNFSFVYDDDLRLFKQPYFVDPYCSWQRGLNKNTNGLLRQYWPKLTDFKKVSKSAVQDVMVKLSYRPRKKLNHKMLSKLMAKHMAEIAA